eukprot:CAMPEP_0172603606 /NCGR_PEP_ID=MMETSP1068-20121228/23870_1 /TAXON_ID=35684 /ORGANISM="Pseudopedinella elastica, Strain CCMP716" /LENGTH=95 /DNA_ID=CAMNT_0013405411 /DNA_START=182 /DNA_END=469 /DNA_ORIENTATION=+
MTSLSLEIASATDAALKRTHCVNRALQLCVFPAVVLGRNRPRCRKSRVKEPAPARAVVGAAPVQQPCVVQGARADGHRSEADRAGAQQVGFAGRV